MDTGIELEDESMLEGRTLEELKEAKRRPVSVIVLGYGSSIPLTAR